MRSGNEEVTLSFDGIKFLDGLENPEEARRRFGERILNRKLPPTSDASPIESSSAPEPNDGEQTTR